MKLLRMCVALVVVACLAGVAYVGQASEPAGAKMTTAASRFLEALKPDQKQKIAFTFDDKERLRWFFTPQQDNNRKPTRKGLPLQDMTPEQQETAKELLRAGTSSSGFTK